MRALELLGELARNELRGQAPPRPDEIEPDERWIASVIEIAVEIGLLDEEVERRVEQRVADVLRARSGAVAAGCERAQDVPGQPPSREPDSGISAPDEASSEAESAPSAASSCRELASELGSPHPLDARAFAALAADEEPTESWLERLSVRRSAFP